MKVALFLSSVASQQDVNIVIIGIRHVAPSWPQNIMGRLRFLGSLLGLVAPFGEYAIEEGHWVFFADNKGSDYQ
jgi:hypothetical protein